MWVEQTAHCPLITDNLEFSLFLVASYYGELVVQFGTITANKIIMPENISPEILRNLILIEVTAMLFVFKECKNVVNFIIGKSSLDTQCTVHFQECHLILAVELKGIVPPLCIDFKAVLSVQLIPPSECIILIDKYNSTYIYNYIIFQKNNQCINQHNKFIIFLFVLHKYSFDDFQ